MSLLVSGIGIVVTTVASYLLAGYMDVPYAFDAQINVQSFDFSAGNGLVCGYFTAQRTARMDPIDAVHHK